MGVVAQIDEIGAASLYASMYVCVCDTGASIALSAVHLPQRCCSPCMYVYRIIVSVIKHINRGRNNNGDNNEEETRMRAKRDGTREQRRWEKRRECPRSTFRTHSYLSSCNLRTFIKDKSHCRCNGCLEGSKTIDNCYCCNINIYVYFLTVDIGSTHISVRNFQNIFNSTLIDVSISKLAVGI